MYKFRIKNIISQAKYLTVLVYTPLSPSDSAALQTCGRFSNSLNRFPTKAKFNIQISYFYK